MVREIVSRDVDAHPIPGSKAIRKQVESSLTSLDSPYSSLVRQSVVPDQELLILSGKDIVRDDGCVSYSNVGERIRQFRTWTNGQTVLECLLTDVMGIPEMPTKRQRESSLPRSYGSTTVISASTPYCLHSPEFECRPITWNLIHSPSNTNRETPLLEVPSLKNR
jgi:hypothetical protein